MDRDQHKKLEELENDEIGLAKELRNFCTPFETERKSKLHETTKIVYEMGQVYVKKAELTKGMDQKLNFIKAATLLHGARVRSEKFLKNYLQSEIKSAINGMQTLLMEKSSGTLSIPLLEISLRVLTAFESYRAEEKKELDLLEIIEEGTPEEEADQKRDEKVEIVKGILIMNTENYKREMQNIAGECLKILGPQPCDFAIIGLGSLARDEVTLYSDFEHVIVLEEGVQEKEEYKEILGYFQWFSILFHIIVIGIGETMLPKIGIESLNDFYSDDKSNDWFFDSITPAGVSFDGMMPHACKIPIGRQRETVNKDFIIELIKPVSQMVSYLTQQQDMINGYCLKDVLCETCYVFGSKEIFSKFQSEADRILESDAERNLHEKVWSSKLMNKNIKARGFILGNEDIFNPKGHYYRPYSVSIGLASRRQVVKGRSGFEKAAKLTKLPCGEKDLLRGFAITCEIRLKTACGPVYEGNHATQKYDVLKYIGWECLKRIYSEYTHLSHYLLQPDPDSRIADSEDILKWEEMILSPELLYSESLKHSSSVRMSLIRKIEQDESFMASVNSITAASVYFSEALTLEQKDKSRQQFLDKSFEILTRDESRPKNPGVDALLSRHHYELHQFQEGMKLANSAYGKFRKVGVHFEYCELHTHLVERNQLNDFISKVIKAFGMSATEDTLATLYRMTRQDRNSNVTIPMVKKMVSEFPSYLRIVTIRAWFLKYLAEGENDKAEEVAQELEELSGIKLKKTSASDFFKRLEDASCTEFDKIQEEDVELQETALNSNLFHEIRRMQASCTQKCMENTDFIRYCQSVLSENTDIVSKLIFGRFLAESQFIQIRQIGDNTTKEEARKDLKILVNLAITDGVLVLDSEAWTQWMLSATKLRLEEKLSEDIVESWEDVDDIMRNGKQSFDNELRPLLMHQAVMAFLHESDKSIGAEDKMKMCKRAIQICQRPENSGSMVQEYLKCIRKIFDISERNNFHGLDIAELLSGAPDSVRKDKQVREELLNMFKAFYTKLVTKKTGLWDMKHCVACNLQIKGDENCMFCDFLQKT